MAAFEILNIAVYKYLENNNKMTFMHVFLILKTFLSFDMKRQG